MNHNLRYYCPYILVYTTFIMRVYICNLHSIMVDGAKRIKIIVYFTPNR